MSGIESSSGALWLSTSESSDDGSDMDTPPATPPQRLSRPFNPDDIRIRFESSIPRLLNPVERDNTPRATPSNVRATVSKPATNSTSAERRVRSQLDGSSLVEVPRLVAAPKQTDLLGRIRNQNQDTTPIHPAASPDRAPEDVRPRVYWRNRGNWQCQACDAIVCKTFCHCPHCNTKRWFVVAYGKVPDDEWVCFDCDLMNKLADSRCVYCDSQKAGGELPPLGGDTILPAPAVALEARRQVDVRDQQRRQIREERRAQEVREAQRARDEQLAQQLAREQQIADDLEAWQSQLRDELLRDEQLAREQQMADDVEAWQSQFRDELLARDLQRLLDQQDRAAQVTSDERLAREAQGVMDAELARELQIVEDEHATIDRQTRRDNQRVQQEQERPDAHGVRGEDRNHEAQRFQRRQQEIMERQHYLLLEAQERRSAAEDQRRTQRARGYY